ncbi:hypothetical protein [Synechococcus sp. PCC 7336]|uniref:hypothetical protein n=1 Tax=Synechococcus sp. PCC 7336 TaxID=195250 RepID=UPI0003614713|nr:hypothetical protein [Synechococcus sp. PCC 7336]
MSDINGTMLQCFHSFSPPSNKLWQSLADRASQLATVGFTALWLPPAHTVSQMDGLDELLSEAWLHPGTPDFGSSAASLRQYNQGGELAATVKALQAEQMQVYADIVFHGESGIVRDRLPEWSRWFLEVTGVNGFRLDAAIDLPFEAIAAWLDSLDRTARDRGLLPGKSLFNFGEYWLGDVGPLRWFLGETKHRLALLDVPLHYNFHHASRAGDRYDLRQIFRGTLVQECSSRAVTFVDNHHSQPLEIHDSVVEAWFKPLAYALILLRQGGYPSVFCADYDGAEYEGRGGDGHTYHIVMDSHQWFIDRLMEARTHYAYGEQRDYFDESHLVGWTRWGNRDRPKTMAVAMSNRSGGMKRMDVARPNAAYRDITEQVSHLVYSDPSGWGEFVCQPGSVSVWVEI